VPFANEAYQFQRKLWENRDLSVASNYLYLFMWATLCILFLLYFKTSFSNMAETELKVTQALEKLFTIAIFHIWTVGA
jgi:valyl-tRNA synthetase